MGVNFAFDDDITMAICFSVFKIQHTGTNGSNIMSNYKIAYYDGSGNQQSFNDVSGAPTDFQMYINSAIVYQLSHQGVSRRRHHTYRLYPPANQHDKSSDTLVIKDSFQITALAVDDLSGSVSKAYLHGSLS